MFCSRCGTENTDGERICKHCGAELSQMAADEKTMGIGRNFSNTFSDATLSGLSDERTVKVCKKCGTTAVASERFCRKCGARFDERGNAETLGNGRRTFGNNNDAPKRSSKDATRMESIKEFEPFFGEWYAENFIGAGSFGSVYTIYKEENGKRVRSALKHISIPSSEAETTQLRLDGMDDGSISTYYSELTKNISAEATLMNKLRGNVNIVSFEDSITIPKSDDVGYDIFIRMELLTPLPKRILDEPFSVAKVVKLGTDICNALIDCRNHGIIHRDIKPDNIFVSESGDYKLGDFGIARQLEKTATFMSKKGTYNYMAPEVYKGEKYGASCDIYSLGLVMYRLLNGGRLPFLPPAPQPISPKERESSIVLRMKGEALTPPIGADDALGRIVLKACAYNPFDRYMTAEELRDALFAYSAKADNSIIRVPLAMGTVIGGTGTQNSGEKSSNGFAPGDRSEATQSMYGTGGKDANDATRSMFTVEVGARNRHSEANGSDDNKKGHPSSPAAEGHNKEQKPTTAPQQSQNAKSRSDEPAKVESKKPGPPSGPENPKKKSKKTIIIPIVAVLAIAAIVIIILSIKNCGKPDNTVSPGTESSLDEPAFIPVSGISLNSSSIELYKGNTTRLSAVISPGDASDQSVTWSTSDASVAEVDENGIVTAKSDGTTVITARTNDGGMTATCSVNVKTGTKAVTGVHLDTAALELTTGSSFTLMAVISPEDASNQKVSWESSNARVAKVDNNGRVEAISAGIATIKVTTEDGGKTAQCDVTVVESTVKVTGVSISKTSLSLKEGETAKLSAAVSPNNATNKNVFWGSDNSNVADVDANGTVTAKGAGSATITVTTSDGERTATCIVSVTAKVISVSGVSLNATNIKLTVGSTYSLAATISPSNATNKNVSWESDDTSVATVSGSGAVNAKTAGTAKITVRTSDGNKTASCTVIVIPANKPVTGISLNRSSLSLEIGGSSSGSLAATISPSDATNKNVSWKSSDTSVATVSGNGEVTAQSAGTATITAISSDGGKTASCTVTVTAKAYSVSWSTGAGFTISVSRTSSPYGHASNGSISNGANVYYGDTLSVSYQQKTGYSLTSHGNTSFTVYDNISSNKIYAEADPLSYTVNWSNGTGYTVSVSRTNSPYGGAGTGSVSNGGRVYYGDELRVTYTKADYYHLTSTGSTYITVYGNIGSSEIYASAEQNPLSDWVYASYVPSGAKVEQRKYRYDYTEYRDVTSYSEASQLADAGWTAYKNAVTTYGSYGAWSGWQTSSVSSSETRQVETKTQYRYARWTNGSGMYTYKKDSSYSLETKWFDSELPLVPNKTIIYYEGSNSGSTKYWWAKPSNVNGVSDKTHTRTLYRYREREKTVTYYMSKTQSDLELESNPSGKSGVSNVREYVRYREK